MPLLTHDNTCIIYTEVTWRLLFTLGCSWEPCTSSLFAGLQVRWYYIVDFIVDFEWVFVGTSAGRKISKIEEAGYHFVGQIATKL